MPVQVPSWFSDFPDFSVATAYSCRAEAQALQSLLTSVAFDVGSAAGRGGSGHWFEEYSCQSRIAKYWLADAFQVLSQLVVSIDEAISRAKQAEREKKLIWGDLLRRAKIAFPAPFLFTMGGYEYLKRRSYPLTIP
ncbi:MAG: hypothetical protein IKZ87_07140, partial [Actinomycetaceae bacterium]|nr:hypothetical protein [Actinomycetaceae bacterium]